MDIAILQDIFGILFFGFIFCLLPLSVIGGLIFSMVAKIGQGTAHQKLGQAVGFSPLTPSTDIKNTTYGGSYRGRAFAIRTFSSVYRYYLDGRSRRAFNIKLRVIAEVRAKEPLGVKAYPNKNEAIAQTFEDGFIIEGGALSPAARQAMLAFAWRGHKKGLRKDLRIVFTRGMRNLSLSDRSDVPPGWITDEALADSKVILTHDHPFVDLTSEEFKSILDELDAVAQAIETETVPPLLSDITTPPDDTVGRNSRWVYIGLTMIGVPACLCLCGIFISFLGAYR
jgi:hypothetical protein